MSDDELDADTLRDIYTEVKDGDSRVWTASPAALRVMHEFFKCGVDLELGVSGPELDLVSMQLGLQSSFIWRDPASGVRFRWLCLNDNCDPPYRLELASELPLGSLDHE